MTRRGQRSELAEAARARRGAATRREAAEAAPDRRRNAGSPASAPNAGSPASAAQDAGSPAPCATRVPRARNENIDITNDITEDVKVELRVVRKNGSNIGGAAHTGTGSPADTAGPVRRAAADGASPTGRPHHPERPGSGAGGAAASRGRSRSARRRRQDPSRRAE